MSYFKFYLLAVTVIFLNSCKNDKYNNVRGSVIFDNIKNNSDVFKISKVGSKNIKGDVIRSNNEYVYIYHNKKINVFDEKLDSLRSIKIDQKVYKYLQSFESIFIFDNYLFFSKNRTSISIYDLNNDTLKEIRPPKDFVIDEFVIISQTDILVFGAKRKPDRHEETTNGFYRFYLDKDSNSLNNPVLIQEVELNKNSVEASLRMLGYFFLNGEKVTYNNYYLNKTHVLDLEKDKLITVTSRHPVSDLTLDKFKFTGDLYYNYMYREKKVGEIYFASIAIDDYLLNFNANKKGILLELYSVLNKTHIGSYLFDQTIDFYNSGSITVKKIHKDLYLFSDYDNKILYKIERKN
ncbi:hypothetical protein [Ichthyobacterium seriolicida]|uniref:Uncharacterized protein n=1 Tax=Ichthyobacterium seriolicida TaxID=242600 RepID=A0A1J1E9J9_9FLAO|nr:hypothetical protein [Ichthyobacterium seriolicida]BAV94579.1 hypothetical protein JBKA6_0566 [Ichthyobacterium seriolicida]